MANDEYEPGKGPDGDEDSDQDVQPTGPYFVWENKDLGFSFEEAPWIIDVLLRIRKSGEFQEIRGIKSGLTHLEPLEWLVNQGILQTSPEVLAEWMRKDNARVYYTDPQGLSAEEFCEIFYVSEHYLENTWDVFAGVETDQVERDRVGPQGWAYRGETELGYKFQTFKGKERLYDVNQGLCYILPQGKPGGEILFINFSFYPKNTNRFSKEEDYKEGEQLASGIDVSFFLHPNGRISDPTMYNLELIVGEDKLEWVSTEIDFDYTYLTTYFKHFDLLCRDKRSLTR